MLKQPSCVLHNLPVHPVDNRYRIADAHVSLVLQQRLAKCHKPYLSAPVTVAGENAHTSIITGNKILNQEFIIITACIQVG